MNDRNTKLKTSVEMIEGSVYGSDYFNYFYSLKIEGKWQTASKTYNTTVKA